MTGKEFFGKLLSNRKDAPEPWDREDSGDGFPMTEVDIEPTHYEEDAVHRSAGGDGQSSVLPEISPSPSSYPNPESSNRDTEPSYADSEPSYSDPTSSYADSEPSYPDSESSYSEPAAAELNEDAVEERFAFEDHEPIPADRHEYDHSHGVERLEHETADHSASDADACEERSSRAEESGRRFDPSKYTEAPVDLEPLSGFEEDERSEPRGDDGSVEHRKAPAEAETQERAAPASHRRDESSSGTSRAAATVTDEGQAHEAHDTAPPSRQPASAEEPTRRESGRNGRADGPAQQNGAPAANTSNVPTNGAAREVAPQRSTAVPLHQSNSAPSQPPQKSQPNRPAPPRSRERREGEASRSKAPAALQGDAELRGIKDRVVIRALEKQIVSAGHVKAAIRERNNGNLKATLWRIVAHQEGVDREAIYREAALTYAFVERKLAEKDVDLEFVRQVADVFPEKRRNRLIELRVVPVGYEFEQQTQMLRVVFLTHDPSLPAVRELMQELNLERYELQYAPETAVKDLLAKAFPRKNEYLERMSEDPLAYDLGMSYEDEKGELIDEEALEAEINRSSLINLFEAALVEAVHKGASDIHIYPNAKRQVEIHFRIDGRLILWHLEDKVHPESLLAVIKDNTMNVDRFERDMAQDGFIQRKVDDTIIRYRVSILPIATAQQNLHAESIVIRVLDDRKVITDLSQLGLLKGALERFDQAIRQPHGMVILTGPTGSGKSTTLVAALHQVVDAEINTLTVEDPVEYIIPGVRQIKLNHKLNLEQALRAILRHDPDVVMVGEMRDRPTAELAIKLANTGHLTFSTLHTNDAPSAVSRLYKMGVEPFLIAYAINLVVAQRLIRSLCQTCKTVDNDPDRVLLDRLGFTKEEIAATTFFRPSGDPTCKTCKGTGYKGRRAISEALYFSRAIRHMVVEADTKIDEDALREMARKEGMLTLQDSAREVVKMGSTSIDEMMRVTAVES